MSFSHTPANEPQPGAVELQNWHQIPFVPNDVKSVIGMVSVHSAEDIMGFDVNAKDSNWVVCVEGPSGARVYFPGCQVASISYAPAGDTVKNVSPHCFVLI